VASDTHGRAKSVVILHVPHASRAIPDSVRQGIILTDSELAAELDAATDSRTDEIAINASKLAALKPDLFINPLSRLVVDPERFVDGSEPMDAVGLGAVYTRTQDGRPLRRDGFDPTPLINEYFHPYHAALTKQVADALASHDAVTIIDVHSYPRDRVATETCLPDAHRPEVCVGTDPFHTPPGLAAAAVDAFESEGFEVAVNSPYSGAIVPLDFYESEPKVRAIMVEIRRDTYQGNDDRMLDLVAALAQLVDAIRYV
jgi:N-formylglutamate deformylase